MKYCRNSILFWGVPLLKISEKYNHYFFQRAVISDIISVYSKNYVSRYIFGETNSYHSSTFVNTFLIVNICKSYCILGFKRKLCWRNTTWKVIIFFFYDICWNASVLKFTIFVSFLRQIAKIKIMQCCP